MKLWNKILNFLTEDVEEEEIQKIRKLPAVEEKPEPVKTETPVQPVEVKAEKEQPKEADPSTFLSIGQTTERKTEKPLTELKPKPAKKESQWSHQEVISPIFGSQNFNAPRYSSSPTVQFEEEVKNDSIIGTIFSPINGKDGHKVIDNDEVSEDIAKMTTTDFIQNISKEEELDNTQGFMDAQYEKTAKQEMPKLKEEETDYYVEKPIITPGESETTDTYENLKLF